MREELDKLLETIVESYKSYMPLADADRFASGLDYSIGPRYVKIVMTPQSTTRLTRKKPASPSVWGFIVRSKTDEKFKRGDILIPKDFTSPRRNHSRGNILEGRYNISWTGPDYVK